MIDKILIDVEEVSSNILRDKIARLKKINCYMMSAIYLALIAIIPLPTKSDNVDYNSLKIAFWGIMMAMSVFCFIKANRIDKRK